ncbi:unnamed protein product [Bursaphelenchus okinawaensis]|uniref:Purple acid phosphatase n=1 Tax=Bursaphelenchus okinawaensis TaxID=465554 RepID=A0A811LBZ8_9BILA|nr:unnamed protein product [Bursaphelenchus okinawaensis]CAG9120418.1 unnamed protein product [Bursaphelenchus okinawaensis]
MNCLLVLALLVGLTTSLPLMKGRFISWKLNGKNHQAPFLGQPEQIHLSYAGHPSAYYVTWLTFDDTEESFVQFSSDLKFDHKIPSEISEFTDDGKKQTKRYIHRAVIKSIEAGKRYFYRVGSDFGWSSVYSFVGLKSRDDGGYRLAIYGDLGNINARSLGKLQRQAQDGQFDMVIHNGDFAYDMHNKDGKFGDEFMRQIEPMAAYLPYMVSPGNHERSYNFSHYVNRFTMPGSDHNLYYSYDLGDAHYIAYSSEIYYWSQFYDKSHIQRQYDWLMEDLKKANANRRNVPWIIVFGHRSMYCSDVEGNCVKNERKMREGLDEEGTFGLEKLFYKYGVDLIIGAHEHNYERHWPMFNFTVYNGTESPYVDPPAPVHIVTGSAGCWENTTHFRDPIAPWSAFRSSNYGFSRMQIFNKTHLYFEQVEAAADKVEDSFWLVKSSHDVRDGLKLNSWPKQQSYHNLLTKY